MLRSGCPSAVRPSACHPDRLVTSEISGALAASWSPCLLGSRYAVITPNSVIAHRSLLTQLWDWPLVWEEPLLIDTIQPLASVTYTEVGQMHVLAQCAHSYIPRVWQARTASPKCKLCAQAFCLLVTSSPTTDQEGPCKLGSVF